jgi:hypothetical protein
MPNDQYKDVQGVLSIDGREQGKDKHPATEETDRFVGKRAE